MAVTGRALLGSTTAQAHGQVLAGTPGSVALTVEQRVVRDGIDEVRRISQLVDLFESGMINEAEFHLKRQDILDGRSEPVDPMRRLKLLSEMLERGLISGGEFETKKQAVLMEL